jgi:hypothetical protein
MLVNSLGGKDRNPKERKVVGEEEERYGWIVKLNHSTPWNGKRKKREKTRYFFTY